MLVMLLNVKVYILVKVEVHSVAFIPEGLNLGKNCMPCGHNLLANKESSV
jgi:hypothetical protein